MIFSEKSETPNLTDYLKAKPDSVVYYGDKKSTASWQLLYFIALKLIAAKHPDELMRLEGKSILGDKIEIGSEIEIREFSHPLGIMRKPDGKWLFAETDFNVQQILLRLKKLMEICKDPLDTMVIYFSANQSQNVSLRTDKSDSPLIRKSLAEIFRPKVPKATPTVTTAEQQYVQWLIQRGEKPSEAQAAFSMTVLKLWIVQAKGVRLLCKVLHSLSHPFDTPDCALPGAAPSAPRKTKKSAPQGQTMPLRNAFVPIALLYPALKNVQVTAAPNLLPGLPGFLCETPRTPAAVRGTQPKPPHPAAFCKAQDAAVLMRQCGDSWGSGVLSAWGKPVCG